MVSIKITQRQLGRIIRQSCSLDQVYKTVRHDFSNYDNVRRSCLPVDVFQMQCELAKQFAALFTDPRSRELVTDWLRGYLYCKAQQVQAGKYDARA